MGSSRTAARAGRQQQSRPAAPRPATPRPLPAATRRDAVRNYHRILIAAREVLGESGAEASMEQIASRAGVGVGTVYRRFASKDALIDELLRVAMEELLAATDQALARTDGHGLQELLTFLGQSFADHARYASLLLDRPSDPAASRRIRAATEELTTRAAAAGTISQHITPDDVLAMMWAMRGLVQAAGDAPPSDWQRFLGIHLAGMRATRL
jgi:AcrR family transcriptional regulator